MAMVLPMILKAGKQTKKKHHVKIYEEAEECESCQGQYGVTFVKTSQEQQKLTKARGCDGAEVSRAHTPIIRAVPEDWARTTALHKAYHNHIQKTLQRHLAHNYLLSLGPLPLLLLILVARITASN